MRDEPLTYSFANGKTVGTTILTLNGPLTLTSMFTLQDQLRSYKSHSLIVDLSNTPYMDSAGLGLIMNAYVSAESHARKFALVGVNQRVASLLEMTKVETILKSFPTVEAAEASS